MSPTSYYIICSILSILILAGISMMSRVKTATLGNRLSALSVLSGVIITLIYYDILDITSIYIFIAIGVIVGITMAKRVSMIEMPQMVALLNGIGGAASATVGSLTLISPPDTPYITFSLFTALMATAIGTTTLVGSLVASGKLHKVLPQKPIIFKAHQVLTIVALIIAIIPALHILFLLDHIDPLTILLAGIPLPLLYLFITILFSGIFGYLFSIRVGGADMPITISLLNSLSGVAGAIAGMAINDILLVSIGGIVGASGLLLTQIMCRAMNRNLIDILLGKTSINVTSKESSKKDLLQDDKEKNRDVTSKDFIKEAKEVIIIPGYGMALAQAQHQVKQLADLLEHKGARVRFAIHPVAGRMPGHMNVLLAEANVPYEELYEMEQINDDFKNTDLVVVIGANDVVNPAAREAEGTPIYGMPVLNADQAKHIIICNFDTKPGYAGVENPLYKEEKTQLILGDAKESLNKIIEQINSNDNSSHQESSNTQQREEELSTQLKEAKEVIIIPGYGMALAQAQHQVKQLADLLEHKGARVRFAIHPVAGRMPGHMNVLLAEANVPYEELYEMEQINDDFKNTDLVVVIGANDVVNPAAREAEGTPIYGMPVLNADQAKHIIICNFDTKPGYAGVENPLYKGEKTQLILGDAKESLNKIIEQINSNDNSSHQESSNTQQREEELSTQLKEAKEVIIIPGYGMALAQAQHQVKQLADLLEHKGARVRFAIHPVAGRMPGHMNVLLAEANVPYEELYEMEQINDDFKNTDLVVVIGANDVVNPAAREAEGTPIYGMPVLNADQAKHIIICNFDTKPGYAGVENPLYKGEKTQLILGDAKESLNKIIEQI